MYNFTKPDLNFYFDNMPLIGIWLKHDYNQVKNEIDIINLFHKWLNISEATTNEVKKKWYYIGAIHLYSLVTLKTFESKKTIKL